MVYKKIVRITRCNIVVAKIYKHIAVYLLAMPSYPSDQYENIAFNLNGYKLPPTVLSVIESLAALLHINTAAVQPSVAKPGPTVRSSRRSHKNRDTSSDWKKDEPFKITETVQYIGFEKKLSDIRVCLNKLSVKNYDVQRDAIFGHIDTILNCEEGVEMSEDNRQQIINCIFDIVSNNQFYAELYATLYKELLDKYSFFTSTIDSILSKYISSAEQIRYEDPDANYDLHCVINKENDSRKAMLMFILMLVDNDVLPKNTLERIFSYLGGAFKQNIDSKPHVAINNEIVENYSLIITTIISEIVLLDTWNHIHSQIIEYAGYSTKDHPGLSNKAKFKFMDMKELIAKHN